MFLGFFLFLFFFFFSFFAFFLIGGRYAWCGGVVWCEHRWSVRALYPHALASLSLWSDRTQLEEFALIKHSWERQDKGRALKAHASRMKFLERCGLLPPPKEPSGGGGSLNATTASVGGGGAPAPFASPSGVAAKLKDRDSKDGKDTSKLEHKHAAGSTSTAGSGSATSNPNSAAAATAQAAAAQAALLATTTATTTSSFAAEATGADLTFFEHVQVKSGPANGGESVAVTHPDSKAAREEKIQYAALHKLGYVVCAAPSVTDGERAVAALVQFVDVLMRLMLLWWWSSVCGWVGGLACV
jgi:hypothetical protein